MRASTKFVVSLTILRIGLVATSAAAFDGGSFELIV